MHTWSWADRGRLFHARSRTRSQPERRGHHRPSCLYKMGAFHAWRPLFDSVTIVVRRLPSQYAATTRVWSWTFTPALTHSSSNKSFHFLWLISQTFIPSPSIASRSRSRLTSFLIEAWLIKIEQITQQRRSPRHHRVNHAPQTIGLSPPPELLRSRQSPPLDQHRR